MNKSKVFIASSSEGSKISRSICANLGHHDIDAVCWKGTSVFKNGDNTMFSLVKALDENSVGIFVMTPDDKLEVREEKYLTSRDNVIFELGMFIGRHGLKQTIIVCHKDVKLPEDLNGITHFRFNANTSDKNIDRKLNPVISSIINYIGDIETKKHTKKESGYSYLSLIKCSPGKQSMVINCIDEWLKKCANELSIYEEDSGVIYGEYDNFLHFRAPGIEESTKFISGLRQEFQSYINAIDTRQLFPGYSWKNTHKNDEKNTVDHLILISCKPSLVEKVYDGILQMAEEKSLTEYGYISRAGIMFGSHDIFFTFSTSSIDRFDFFLSDCLNNTPILEDFIENTTSLRVNRISSRKNQI
ncbi:MAG: nucleotide-binding protein [Gammaproteobacteria bacterium]|nr:nucleotide-binding protein [Gammaproteobacteria bacterium]